MAPKILIIGATGVIGKPITDQILVVKANFDRIAILTSSNTVTTKTDQVQALTAQGVDVLVGDLSKEGEVKKAYEGLYTRHKHLCCIAITNHAPVGIDTVISCVGRGAIETQIPL